LPLPRRKLTHTLVLKKLPSESKSSLNLASYQLAPKLST
jgi:hypothetical protein